ncbi:MAG: hypothetical protein JXJ30_01695 [Halothiobacillaceae bacterium]|nr:hypothetical protein [Halothiobacillaceae bacterium]HER35649.1 hypothetical protein [Halothiobacillaceae bacterium]
MTLSAPLSAAPPNGHAAENDARQAVSLPAPMRAHMLANMRDHLEAMGEIQAALADEDFATAAEIAEARLGMSSMDDHGASRIARFMPEGMREIGVRMHRAASEFARISRDAEITGDLRPPLEALAGVNRQCVACHAGYRAVGAD